MAYQARNFARLLDAWDYGPGGFTVGYSNPEGEVGILLILPSFCKAGYKVVFICLSGCHHSWDGNLEAPTLVGSIGDSEYHGWLIKGILREVGEVV